MQRREHLLMAALILASCGIVGGVARARSAVSAPTTAHPTRTSPVSAPPVSTALVIVTSVRIAYGGRGAVTMRVTAPATGRRLPVVLLSHGFKLSSEDYAPLAEYWAASGFVTIQPDHPDSRLLALPLDDPRLKLTWRYRIEDMRAIIDRLPAIEAAVPGLAGRVDNRRILAAGHSFGGHTVQALLGARSRDPATGTKVDLSDTRVLAGIIIAGPGAGDRDLIPAAAATSSYLDVDWSTMTRPVLVVTGDRDNPIMSTRDWRWHVDPYERSPAKGKCLAILPGGEHFLGGIQGHARTDTTDANPDRVGYVQRLTLRYLQLAARGIVAPSPSDFDIGPGGTITCK